MPVAAVNDTTIHYEIDGAGPPCFVLHGGLGLDHLLYRRTLQPLASSLQLVFVDHRGNGRSGRPPIETITMEQLADDVAAVADQLGVDRFLVLGHSYGGFIAQEVALRHGARLDGLILATTTPGQLGTGEDVSTDEQGPPMPPEVLALMTSPPSTDEEMAAGMDQLLPAYFHALSVEKVLPLTEGTIYSAAAMARGFQILPQWSSVDRLSTIPCPVLVLAGRHDVFTSYPQAHRIARRIPDAEVALFEASGHFPWLEEPDAFFAAVQDWLVRKVGVGVQA